MPSLLQATAACHSFSDRMEGSVPSLYTPPHTLCSSQGCTCPGEQPPDPLHIWKSQGRPSFSTISRGSHCGQSSRYRAEAILVQFIRFPWRRHIFPTTEFSQDHTHAANTYLLIEVHLGTDLSCCLFIRGEFHYLVLRVRFAKPASFPG